jgi:hypothetical protein
VEKLLDSCHALMNYGVGPAAKQVIVFEERVMPVAGVRHHQRLHGDGIFFHAHQLSALVVRQKIH